MPLRTSRTPVSPYMADMAEPGNVAMDAYASSRRMLKLIESDSNKALGGRSTLDDPSKRNKAKEARKQVASGDIKDDPRLDAWLPKHLHASPSSPEKAGSISGGGATSDGDAKLSDCSACGDADRRDVPESASLESLVTRNGSTAQVHAGRIVPAPELEHATGGGGKAYGQKSKSTLVWWWLFGLAALILFAGIVILVRGRNRHEEGEAGVFVPPSTPGVAGGGRTRASRGAGKTKGRSGGVGGLEGGSITAQYFTV